jgi:hypothetical protein
LIPAVPTPVLDALVAELVNLRAQNRLLCILHEEVVKRNVILEKRKRVSRQSTGRPRRR